MSRGPIAGPNQSYSRLSRPDSRADDSGAGEPGISFPEPRFVASRSVRVNLEFADIAFDDCRPEALRGYGEVPESTIPELNGLVEEMRSLVRKLSVYLTQGIGQDPLRACKSWRARVMKSNCSRLSSELLVNRAWSSSGPRSRLLSTGWNRAVSRSRCSDASVRESPPY